ncbi:DUF2946 domain-containing protein [Pandoraea sputorum]|uniref:DUF2946 domain-containing protein n=1 Tax=Pandoraea sputorum TaxID=93222 RepID=UPI001241481A|nr:DUF2946 domain-containing protein [Pandoraea sputorum]
MLNRHRHLCAWLGVFAMWFAITSPLVSQWCRAHAATPEAIVCGAVRASLRGDGARRAPDPMWHLDACGYCGFFAHAPAINATGAPALASAPLVFVRVTVRPVGQARAERSPCAGRSRAPPERT